MQEREWDAAAPDQNNSGWLCHGRRAVDAQVAPHCDHHCLEVPRRIKHEWFLGASFERVLDCHHLATSKLEPLRQNSDLSRYAFPLQLHVECQRTRIQDTYPDDTLDRTRDAQAAGAQNQGPTSDSMLNLAADAPGLRSERASGITSAPRRQLK